MDEQKQNKLLGVLQKACPSCEFSLLSTMQRGDKMLLMVKGNVGSLASWEYGRGSELWWDIIQPTAEKLGIKGDIRTLFILSDTEFVFYAPVLGIRGGVFGDMKKPVRYEAVGDEYHRHYLGECQTVTDVINYLQKKKKTF